MTLIDLQEASPHRAPDWRWSRARAIRCGLLRNTGRPDPWVGRALRFQRDHAEGRYDTSCPGSARPDPAVFGAFRVWASADPRPRRELEARALAGQSHEAIGARLGLTSDVVEAFERCFFEVRDRLGAPGYVMSVVIRHGLHDGFASGDVESIMKFYAYAYGPVALDAVIAVLGVRAKGGASPVVEVEQDLARAVRASIAARSIPITERTSPILIRLNERALEFERRAAASSASNSPIRTSVEPWSSPESAGTETSMSPMVGPLAASVKAGDEPSVWTGVAESIAESGPTCPGSSMRRTA